MLSIHQYWISTHTQQSRRKLTLKNEPAAEVHAADLGGSVREGKGALADNVAASPLAFDAGGTVRSTYNGAASTPACRRRTAAARKEAAKRILDVGFRFQMAMMAESCR